MSGSKKTRNYLDTLVLRICCSFRPSVQPNWAGHRRWPHQQRAGLLAQAQPRRRRGCFGPNHSGCWAASSSGRRPFGWRGWERCCRASCHRLRLPCASGDSGTSARVWSCNAPHTLKFLKKKNQCRFSFKF